MAAVPATGDVWKTVGVLGGGQLGRMMAEAAHRLGARITVLDPTENCPAAQGERQAPDDRFPGRERFVRRASRGLYGIVAYNWLTHTRMSLRVVCL